MEENKKQETTNKNDQTTKEILKTVKKIESFFIGSATGIIILSLSFVLIYGELPGIEKILIIASACGILNSLLSEYTTKK